MTGAASSTGRRLAWIGGALLAVSALMAIFAPLLSSHDPEATAGAPYESPSLEFPLGTNDVGQDLFAQLLYGARISLTIGVLSAILATALGLAVALLAGYFRGRVEGPLMRLVDLTLALPFFVLVIVLAAFFGRGLLITIVVISAVMWAKPARVLYSNVVKVREYQHVLAARAMGASPARVLGRHIVPRLTTLGVAEFVRTANVAVFLESALAFLGLGDPTRISWGSMLFFANARSAFLTDAWLWWILPPGLALTAVIVGFAFVGYALEERSDPRLSGRRPMPRPAPAPGPSEAAAGAQRPSPAPQAEGTVLEIRGLSVRYGGEHEICAVDDVSFAVAPGRTLGLVGESGSGKSTLAFALMGLLRPPAQVLGGSILLAGRDLRTLRGPEATRIRGQEISLVPQGAMSALNPAYTIHRQVSEAAALTRSHSGEADARATEMLEQVGIERARQGAYPHELSGGMRQRALIAMAVVNEPRVVIADEPVTGVDVVTQGRILQLLLDLRERLGLAVILISHDMPLVARTADEIVVMQHGRVVEAGATATVVAAPGHPHTRALLQVADVPPRRAPQADRPGVGG
ncbi:MAG: dipeptide/oligopeptide/nickel ABC transporter permease/ATP-binding protein [Thermoleophilia bacterium]